MPMPIIPRRAWPALLLAALCAAPAAGAQNPMNASTLSPMRAAADHDEPRVYIVQLRDPAAVGHEGLRAAALTAQPDRGRRFDASAPGVRAYTDRLTAEHDALLESMGASGSKLYSYRYAFNGFAARLTAAQAAQLRRRPEVLGVWENSMREVKTNASPGFLGLRNADDGLWEARGLSGEGVIIGIIDSGITPGHPSFSDTREADRPRLCRSTWAETSLLGLWLCQRFKNRDDVLMYEAPERWQGTCQAGQDFGAAACNNKLLGARYYLDGFLAEHRLDENEFRSPRDADGHGTHIASVAAGNAVRAELRGTRVAGISGVAPRAHLAVYKACWLTPGADRGSCSVADLTRAIEDAVADGVDVINYSVGSYDDIDNPDDLALLAATEAGVLVVAAAGNEGPEPETMLSPAAAPWVVGVAASSRTGDRFQQAIRVDGPGDLGGLYAAVEATFTPELRNSAAVEGELVLADDGTAGLFPGPSIGTDWDACEPLRNVPETDGRMVLVQRGNCDFELKVRHAENAGAVGVVVASASGDPVMMTGTRGSVNIPAVMLSRDDGNRLFEALLDDAALRVTMDRALLRTVRDAGNLMEAFSARGPSPFTPDILKPDITAPGVEILAAQSPDVANGLRGERYQYLSGTSMAVPHVAGIAALLREAHPDWSPAALKSALVTTARQDVLREDGETAANPFDFGGGHVQPNRAVDPGLVYDAGSADYDAFLCGRERARLGVDCEALEADGWPAAPTDLNLPSIATSRFVHEQVIRRRVTNVGEAAQFTATVEAPGTIAIEVVPSVLSLGAGESADFEVRLSAGTTDLDTWQFGALTWSDGSRSVRSPIAIRALALDVPDLVVGSGASGSVDFEIRAGYQGAYAGAMAGLQRSGDGQPEATRSLLTNTVADDPDNAYVFVPPASGTTLPASVRRIPVEVPEGTLLLRVALYNEDTSGDDDLDLYLYRCPGFTTCEDETASGQDDSNEAIAIFDPPPGEYYVDVHGFETELGSAEFTLSVWTVGPDLGNADVAGPATVSAGSTATVSLEWAGLAPGRHMGLVLHGDGSTTRALTAVEVNVAAEEEAAEPAD